MMRKPSAPLDAVKLYEYAVKSLGRAMRTEAELRRLMAQRVEPGEAGETLLNAVVIRLREYGFLNDAAYAETYARLRHENEKLGARRVRQSLSQKGVDPELVNEVIDARYGDQDEVALARQHLERKHIPKPTNEKETARVMRRLVAAGFSIGSVYKVLRQWDVPDESLAALASAEEELEEE